LESLNPQKKRRVKLPDMLVDENLTERVSINVIQKRQFSKDIPDFAIIFQIATRITSCHLSPTACQLVLHMIGWLQYGNHIGVNQQTMAERLGTSLITIKRAIKELTDNNIILPYKDKNDTLNADGRRNNYIINPMIVWKGKEHKRKEAIKADPKQYKLPFSITEEPEPKAIGSADENTI
jgi:hypothetical protein